MVQGTLFWKIFFNIFSSAQAITTQQAPLDLLLSQEAQGGAQHVGGCTPNSSQEGICLKRDGLLGSISHSFLSQWDFHLSCPHILEGSMDQEWALLCAGIQNTAAKHIALANDICETYSTTGT